MQSGFRYIRATHVDVQLSEVGIMLTGQRRVISEHASVHLKTGRGNRVVLESDWGYDAPFDNADHDQDKNRFRHERNEASLCPPVDLIRTRVKRKDQEYPEPELSILDGGASQLNLFAAPSLLQVPRSTPWHQHDPQASDPERREHCKCRAQG